MKLIVIGDVCNAQVDADEFAIPETSERFAVHRSIGRDALWRGQWSVSHVRSGINFAFGSTAADAKAAARRSWAQMTPYQRDLWLMQVNSLGDAFRGQGYVRQES